MARIAALSNGNIVARVTQIVLGTYALLVVSQFVAIAAV